MTHTLLDVAPTLGLPITGFEAPRAHAFELEDLGIIFTKKASIYSAFITTNLTTLDEFLDVQHNAFF